MMSIRPLVLLFACAPLASTLPLEAATRWDLNGDGAVDAADISCAVKENAETGQVCSEWSSFWPQPDWRTARDLGLLIHSIDQDGDGFSDWFEENMAATPPDWANDRHVVLALHYIYPLPEYVLPYYLPLLDDARIHRIYASGNEAQSRFYELMEDLEDKVQPQDHLWVFIRGSGGISYGTQVGYYWDMFDALRPIPAARKIVVITGCYDTSIHRSVTEETDVMVLSGTPWRMAIKPSPLNPWGGPDGMGNNDGYVSLAEVHRYSFEHRLKYLEDQGVHPQSLLDQVREDPESMLDTIIDKNLQIPILWDPQGLAEVTYLGEWVGDY